MENGSYWCECNKEIKIEGVYCVEKLREDQRDNAVKTHNLGMESTERTLERRDGDVKMSPKVTQ